MTAIVDYRAGNLTSVKLAFDALGETCAIVSDPSAVRRADRVVFPGVGAAGRAMASLRELGLDSAIRDAISAGKPFLGICLGMQALFTRTEEDGGVELLGVLPGQVRRFPAVAGCKVPQIGWNQVRGKDFNGEEYYFVHSYCAEIVPCTVGVAEYAGVPFTAAVRRGSLFATQFHPEKSGRTGMEFLKRFLSA